MKREPHVRFCEGLGCNSLGLLTSSLDRVRAAGECPEEPVSGNVSVRPSACTSSRGSRERRERTLRVETDRQQCMAQFGPKAAARGRIIAFPVADIELVTNRCLCPFPQRSCFSLTFGLVRPARAEVDTEDGAFLYAPLQFRT